jgi:hypothetical protein
MAVQVLPRLLSELNRENKSLFSTISHTPKPSPGYDRLKPGRPAMITLAVLWPWLVAASWVLLPGTFKLLSEMDLLR